MNERRLGAIFGNGRSGTTWLGAIVSSHPEVAYRFEPFKRARHLGDAQQQTSHMLDSDRLEGLDADAIYDALIPAFADWEKPPFFPKSYRTRLSVGRSLLWPPARRSALAHRLFCSLYTPLDRPFIVFKEVAYEDAYRAFVERTRVPLVYLVRHPCAIVNSLMRGQEKGLMGTGRQQIVDSYLENHAADLWQRFKDRIPTMGPHQKEALLWRANVESCFEVSDQRPGSIAVFYENLCRQPAEESARVLANFGLDIAPQVAAFIETSTAPEQRRSGRVREIGINQYFSVFRDPKAAMNQWKEGLTAEQCEDVFELVRDSRVFEAGVRLAEWDA